LRLFLGYVAMQFSSLFTRRRFEFNSNATVAYFSIDHFAPVLGGSPKPGTFLKLGVCDSVSKERWRLNSFVDVLFDTGAFGNNQALVGNASIGVARMLSRRLMVTLPLRITTPATHVTDGRKTQYAITGGFTYWLGRQ
jgi:hypothetical protein